MYLVARKLHLWVGLILAIVLLIEAITGLILAEPWIVGQGQTQMPQGGKPLSGEQKFLGTGNTAQGDLRISEGARPMPSGAFGIAKGLHQGKVGNLDLKWIVDLSAIGLIILTLTGIYLSIPILRAGRKKR